MAVHRDTNSFNCASCKWNRHCDESNPAPIKQWVVPGVIESDICLLPMITDKSRQLLRLYKHYKNQFLPVTGGILDQPNAFLQYMEIIDGLVNE